METEPQDLSGNIISGVMLYQLSYIPSHGHWEEDSEEEVL